MKREFKVGVCYVSGNKSSEDFIVRTINPPTSSRHIWSNLLWHLKSCFAYLSLYNLSIFQMVKQYLVNSIESWVAFGHMCGTCWYCKDTKSLWSTVCSTKLHATNPITNIHTVSSAWFSHYRAFKILQQEFWANTLDYIVRTKKSVMPTVHTYRPT